MVTEISSGQKISTCEIFCKPSVRRTASKYLPLCRTRHLVHARHVPCSSRQSCDLLCFCLWNERWPQRRHSVCDFEWRLPLFWLAHASYSALSTVRAKDSQRGSTLLQMEARPGQRTFRQLLIHCDQYDRRGVHGACAILLTLPWRMSATSTSTRPACYAPFLCSLDGMDNEVSSRKYGC